MEPGEDVLDSVDPDTRLTVPDGKFATRAKLSTPWTPRDSQSAKLFLNSSEVSDMSNDCDVIHFLNVF